MLGWTLTFLFAALLTALLGYADLEGTAATIAKALLLVFVVVFVLSLVWSQKRS